MKRGNNAVLRLRTTQNNWLARRVNAPFAAGVSSTGINYIDTNPIGNNSATINETFNTRISPGELLTTSLKDAADRKDEARTERNSQKITLLLAHGYSMGSGMWANNIDMLRKIPNVGRIVAFDWKGMGASNRDDNGPVRSSLSLFDDYKYHSLSKQLDDEKKMNSSSSGEEDGLVIDALNDGSIAADATSSRSRSLRELLKSPRSLLKSHARESIQKSYTPDSTINYFLDPMLPFFKELHLDQQPVVMVAHSLGGYLGANLVHRYPGLVQSLVLASPVGVCESYGIEGEILDASHGKILPLQAETQYSDILDNIQQLSDEISDIKQNMSLDSSQKLEHIDDLLLRRAQDSPNWTQPLPDDNHQSSLSQSHLMSGDDGDPATTFTKLSGSIQDRLRRPLILRNPLISVIDTLWKTNSTPQSLLRHLPSFISRRVSTSLAARMFPHDSELEEDDYTALVDYLHELMTAPPCGERALNSLLHIDYPSLRSTQSPSDAMKPSSSHLEHVQQQHKYIRKIHPPTVSDSQADNLQTGKTDSNPANRQTRTSRRGQSNNDDDDKDEHEECVEIMDQHGQVHHYQLLDSSTLTQNDLDHDDNIKVLLTPSVFARKGLTQILNDIDTPMHFVFGSHDWLFHHDVPLIIDDLTDKIVEKHQTAQDELRRLELLQSPTMMNRITMENDQDTQTINQQLQQAKESLETKVRNKDLLNLRPFVTLSVLPESGHHLYANNPEAFHIAIDQSVQHFSRAMTQNMHKYGTPFDRELTSGLLDKYIDISKQRQEAEHSPDFCEKTSKVVKVTKQTLTSFLKSSTTAEAKGRILSPGGGKTPSSSSPTLIAPDTDIASHGLSPSHDTNQVCYTPSLFHKHLQIPAGNLTNSTCKYAQAIYGASNYHGVSNAYTTHQNRRRQDDMGSSPHTDHDTSRVDSKLDVNELLDITSPHTPKL